MSYPEHQIFRNDAGCPVVGLDIDGTLGDYHGHFLKFAEGWLGRTLPHPQEINPGMRLSDFMTIPHEQYRQIKLAYRQGGLKRTMPVYDGAHEITRALRTAGAKIWLCTTRPYNKLDNIDADTREWLERNRINYDHVLWDDGEGGGKYTELVRQVGIGSVVAVADDLVEQLHQAWGAGIPKCYLREQPYNVKGVDAHGLIRVAGLADLHVTMMNDVSDWWKHNAK
jgi:hypothetical protein